MFRMQFRRICDNKEIVQEVNYLGSRLMNTDQMLRNFIVMFDRYVKYNKDDEKFRKYLDDEKKERVSVKDELDKAKK